MGLANVCFTASSAGQINGLGGDFSIASYFWHVGVGRETAGPGKLLGIEFIPSPF